MRGDILPPELARWQNLPFIKRRSRYEYSAACPRCGDTGHVGNDWPDRFRMFADKRSRGWCRGCSYFAWADEDEGYHPTPAQIKEAEEHRLELARRERRRIQLKIERLREEAMWEGYHKALTESTRLMWREAGIPDSFQDYFRLGYCHEYPHPDFQSPALTLPFFDTDWSPVNLQYRLLSPPKPDDKYRFTSGIPAPLYKTDPDKPIEGRVLVCEGAKKALVVYINLLEAGLADDYDAIVALPSKYISNYQQNMLKESEDITLCLDPDTAFGHVETQAEKLVARSVKVATLPVKADDFFTQYGGTAAQFAKILRLAQPVG